MISAMSIGYIDINYKHDAYPHNLTRDAGLTENKGCAAGTSPVS
jgi:hypothetical protein